MASSLALSTEGGIVLGNIKVKLGAEYSLPSSLQDTEAARFGGYSWLVHSLGELQSSVPYADGTYYATWREDDGGTAYYSAAGQVLSGEVEYVRDTLDLTSVVLAAAPDMALAELDGEFFFDGTATISMEAAPPPERPRFWTAFVRTTEVV